MDSGTAIAALKTGTHIRRESWDVGVFLHYEDIEGGRIICRHTPRGSEGAWNATDEDFAADEWETTTT
jgi:hypothetical protein